MNTLIALISPVAAICFILALKGLASPVSARRGNWLGIIGMSLALLATFSLPTLKQHFLLILLIAAGGATGTLIACNITMTAIPQLVAGFHSLVGLAAVLVAFCVFLAPESFGALGTDGQIATARLLELTAGLLIGAITFTGSVIAFLKLQGLISGRPVRFSGQVMLNVLTGFLLLVFIVKLFYHPTLMLLGLIALLSLALGVLLIIPIGGADMPVVISMLNSYSGWAAAGIGFTLDNTLLIITGALVGASGAILSYIMCAGMNRSLTHVIFGAFSQSSDTQKAATDTDVTHPIHEANADDAAYLLANARDVIIVPGYGMAVAHAQHAVKELMDALEKRGIRVRFAIHPVAGRMPGHMNVLLAEANIPYDHVHEQSEINRDFTTSDVAIVIGANDITNPAAKSDPHSPIYGMPVLDVESARNVLFLKRSLGHGYSGVDNALFWKDNTWMVFGDAKKTTEAIARALSALPMRH